MRPEEACGGEATRAVGALPVCIAREPVPGSSVLDFLSLHVNGFTGSVVGGVLPPIWPSLLASPRAAGINGQRSDIGSLLARMLPY
jgi:hypothetical protein